MKKTQRDKAIPAILPGGAERADAGAMIKIPVDGSRPFIEDRKKRVLSPTVCYWCGTTPKPPDELIAVPGNPIHQSFLLVKRRPCCHGPVSTEHFGTILDYLCDGWARAQLICRLYNAHMGLPPRPNQPRPKKGMGDSA